MAGIIVENFSINQEGCNFNVFGDNEATTYRMKINPDVFVTGSPNDAMPSTVDAIVLGDSDDTGVSVEGVITVVGSDTFVDLTFSSPIAPGNMREGPFISVQLTFGFGSA